MATSRHLKRDKPPAKTSRQRKQEFDSRMKNRGGVDPSRPERWAVVFYLTRHSVDQLKRVREEARFEGSEPSQNAALFEDMLNVYMAWRGGGGDVAHMPPRDPPAGPNTPQPSLSAELRAFQRSIEDLRRALDEQEDFHRHVLGAHLQERWTTFAHLTDRLLSASGCAASTPEQRTLWFREFEDYLKGLLELALIEVDSGVELPKGRGELFERVLKRLKA